MSLKDLSSIASYAVTGVTALSLLWDRFLWALPMFYPWLSKRPDLRGTWKGELRSNWIDPETKRRRGPIEVYLVIRQTNSTIDVRLFSAESSSISLSGDIFSDNADVRTLAIAYRNIPKVLIRQRSPMSNGGMLLSIRGDRKVHLLDGEYWTDRATKGEVKFTVRSRAICHDFDQASKMAYPNEI